MDQQPKIPTLKDTQRPQVKIKGLGVGLTLIDRLKQFKKKDLAFILAGLGTLFMAPLAEHFMMSPESADGQLQQGWGRAPGGNFFGGGGTPYESNNGIASGGAVGSSGDIITPLNVRDPSALVMGPGAAQQPPAGSIAPPTPPSGRSEADLKDALAGSASRGASSALGRSPMPIPKVPLGGSGLRGLGVAGGSSSASSSLAPIAPAQGGRPDTGGGGLNLVRPDRNFRTAAGGRGSSNPTGLDATKRAGQNAGDQFSRTGSALSALNEAAKETIPTGGSGYGGHGHGGLGPNDKFPGGGYPPGVKSVGEALSFIAARERMMQEIQLAFEKRKLKDPELLLYGIRNDLVKSLATEGIGKPMGVWLGKLLSPTPPDAEYKCGATTMSRAQMTVMCSGDGKTRGGQCWSEESDGTTMTLYSNSGGTASVLLTCVKTGKTASNPDPKAERGVTPNGQAAGLTNTTGESTVFVAGNSLEELCGLLESALAENKKGSSGGSMLAAPVVRVVDDMRVKTGKLIAVRDALYRSGSSERCGAIRIKEEFSVKELFEKSVGTLLAAPAVPAMLEMSDKDKNDVKSANDQVTIARKSHRDAMELLTKAKAHLETVAQDKGQLYDPAPFARNPLSATYARLFDQAKTARDGFDGVIKDQSEYLGKLHPALLRAEAASDPKGTLQAVIGVTAKFKPTADEVSNSFGIKSSASPQDPKISTPADKEAVLEEAKVVLEKAGTAMAAVDQAQQEAAKLKTEKTDPLPQSSKDIFEKAFTAVGDMQITQRAVMGDLQMKLDEMSKPPKGVSGK
ncbi:MAG: hypothetical protein AAB036_08365 [Elusimicrobiota bacterium]